MSKSRESRSQTDGVRIRTLVRYSTRSPELGSRWRQKLRRITSKVVARYLLAPTAMLSLELAELRAEIEHINFALLELLNRRAQLVTAIQRVKTRSGMPTYLPEREQQILGELVRRNLGPFSDETIRHLFKEILRASVSLMESHAERALKVSRAHRAEDLHVVVAGQVVGDAPIVIAGPCAVESEEQMDESGRFLASRGVRFLRGGAFKPRSSPYSFQGLGRAGLELLRSTADAYGMVAVTEVMDPRQVELVERCADVLQVGARNMYNYDLLKELGRCGKPVLLKRGLSATLDELLWSAEYVVAAGNDNVILCERGIRTYERATRNTLDLSAVPLLRQQSFLPVIVDVSHAVGRRDILAPMARAALAVGANGLMVEVHPSPAVARSDSQQQLDFAGFDRFLAETGLTRISERTGITIAAAPDGYAVPGPANRAPPPHAQPHRQSPAELPTAIGVAPTGTSG